MVLGIMDTSFRRIPKELQSANLMMRPFHIGDGPAVYEYWKSDPGWEQFNTSVPSGFTVKDAIDFVTEMSKRNRINQPNWALVHDDTVVGVVSLNFEKGHRSASLGYGIHAELRGRGFCAAAARQVLGLAFSTFPQLEKVLARTDPKNRASIAVLNKLGFSRLQSSANEVFCLLRSVWESQNAT